MKSIKFSFFITVFFFVLIALVVWFANVRLNINGDAIYESEFTSIPARTDQTIFFWHNLYRWDAGWYAQIIDQGYTIENAAFFPLYPFVLGGVSYALPFSAKPIHDASFIIAFFIVCGSVFLIHKIAEKEKLSDTHFPVLLFLFFPTAFFIAAPYTEGLFILLLLACVYFVKTKQFLLAAACGFLLALTRITGITYIVYPLWCAYELFKIDKQTAKKVALTALGPVTGFLAVCVYFFFKLGDPLAFVHAQAAWGRTTNLNPVSIFSRYAHDWNDFISLSMYHPRFSAWLLNFVFTACGILAVAYLWKARKRDYALLTVALMSLPLLSGSTYSIPRLILPAIPFISLVVAEKLHNPSYRTLVIVASVVMWSILLLMFTRQYWVA